MDFSHVFVVSIIFALSRPTTPCPTGCTCGDDVISCTQLTTFPQPFKSIASRVEIFMSHLPEIPPKAFSGVPNVQFIHFQQVQIGTIQPCAFSAISKPFGLLIDLTEIGTIKGNAFNNIVGNMESHTEFSISSSVIERIESFAFDSIQGFQLFQIHSTDIELMQHYALYGLTNIESIHMFDNNITTMERNAMAEFSKIGSMDIYHTTFQDLECNTLDTLRAELGRNFSFYSLDVVCDCGLAWLTDAGHSDPGFILDDVICYSPDKFKRLHLKNISRSELCSVSQLGCDTPKPSRPESCSSPAGSAPAGVLSVSVVVTSVLAATLEYYL